LKRRNSSVASFDWISDRPHTVLTPLYRRMYITYSSKQYSSSIHLIGAYKLKCNSRSRPTFNVAISLSAAARADLRSTCPFDMVSLDLLWEYPRFPSAFRDATDIIWGARGLSQPNHVKSVVNTAWTQPSSGSVAHPNTSPILPTSQSTITQEKSSLIVYHIHYNFNSSKKRRLRREFKQTSLPLCNYSAYIYDLKRIHIEPLPWWHIPAIGTESCPWEYDGHSAR